MLDLLLCQQIKVGTLLFVELASVSCQVVWLSIKPRSEARNISISPATRVFIKVDDVFELNVFLLSFSLF